MVVQAANLDLSSLTSTDGDIVIVKAWGAATITISASGTGGIVSSKNDPAGASGTGTDATYTINEGDSFLFWKQNNLWYIMA